MLRINDLSFSYPNGERILENVNIEISQNGVYSIIGLNGAGKSTLLKLCASILRPELGSIELDGRDISKISYRELSRVRSYLPQNVFLPVDFPVIDFIKYGAYLDMDIFSRVGKEREAEIEKIMAEMNILHLRKRMTSSLSAGEMQRIHIAKGLVQGGKIILMDEPVSTIDVSFRRKFALMLKKLRSERIILLVTHDLQLAFGLSERIISLRAGKVISDDKPDEAIKQINEVYGENIGFINHKGRYIFTDEEEM
ncbi:MAG: ABC transporter ATP-binding protein [bacterium]|nr:ABC transporter ATP-binding protein [bacterium]